MFNSHKYPHSGYRGFEINKTEILRKEFMLNGQKRTVQFVFACISLPGRPFNKV